MVVRVDGIPLGQSDTCYYCGRRVVKWKQVAGFPAPPDNYTLDHVVPQWRAGRHSKTVTACFACNQDKGRLDIHEYRLIQAFRAGVVKLPDYRFAAEV